MTIAGILLAGLAGVGIGYGVGYYQAYGRIGRADGKNAAELERAVAELDAFGYTVAHDLKNPLSGIMGYTAVLLADVEAMDAPPPDMHQSLKAIERHSQHMVNIIEGLLLLARARSRDEVDIQPVDLAGAARAALERLSYMVEEHEASITLADGDWPLALGYPAWVEALWANYLSNAIKYGGEPPQVTLGASLEPGGMVRCWVRDNGPGIPPEKQAGLFEPFARLEGAPAEGHGLGLSIVRRITARLGGAVGVESIPGQGCTFWFTLPPLAE